MSRILLLISIAVCLCASCKSEEEKTLSKKAKEFSKLCQAEEYEQCDIVYLLDGSCSLCLMEFIKFTQIANLSRTNKICFVYVEDTYKNIVNYYIEQYNSILETYPTKLKFLFVHNAYPFGFSVTRHNTAYFASEDFTEIRPIEL